MVRSFKKFESVDVRFHSYLIGIFQLKVVELYICVSNVNGLNIQVIIGNPKLMKVRGGWIMQLEKVELSINIQSIR